MTSIEGSWAVHTVDGAEVRLRTGRIGLVRADVKAPVTGGELTVTPDEVSLTLRLALDQLRTGNFILQAAARTLVVRHHAHLLTYAGAGDNANGPWRVVGHAASGDIDIELQLDVTAIGPAGNPMGEIELTGSASLGTVHLPLPGLGTVDDFGFDVDARLAMKARP